MYPETDAAFLSGALPEHDPPAWRLLRIDPEKRARCLVRQPYRVFLAFLHGGDLTCCAADDHGGSRNAYLRPPPLQWKSSSATSSPSHGSSGRVRECSGYVCSVSSAAWTAGRGPCC